jgi:ABC-type branched-subunit amino acid transport system substrate-binding protein
MPVQSRLGKSAFVAGAMVFVITMAACGSSSNNSSSKSTTTLAPGASTTTLPELKSYGQGVTSKTVKIGIALVDWSSIQQFINFNHGDEQKIDQVFIDDINKNGGIGGKQLIAVYQKYTPIGSAGPTQVCTTFTEDQKVFAVLGNIEDPSGAGQLCVAKQHKTIMIGHDLTAAEVNGANGLMSTPDIVAERRLNVLLALLKSENTLQGKTVAVLAEPTTKARINDTITPALKDMGVKQGTSAVLSITGTDTTLAQGQLNSFIERWKTEGVNAILISGADVVAKQFVEKIAKEMPGTLLMSDSTASAGSAGQDEVAAKANPNPYEGMLSANGLNDQQSFEEASMQKCIKTYEDATGQTVVAPKDLKPNAQGIRVQVYVAISDICRELTMFEQVAAKAGPYLNNQNWLNAENTIGPIQNMPGSQYASLNTGKYDADDAFALVAFKSSANDFVATTPIKNTPGNS